MKGWWQSEGDGRLFYWRLRRAKAKQFVRSVQGDRNMQLDSAYL